MTDELPAPREHTPEGIPVIWDRVINAVDFIVQTPHPITTPEERGRLLDIIEGEYVEANDVIGHVFEYSTFVMHPVKLVDQETGELIDAVRTLLPQSNGPPIKFVAMGVIQSIQRIAWQQGRPPPYDPPIMVQLKQAKVRGKGRTYKLIPVLTT